MQPVRGVFSNIFFFRDLGTFGFWKIPRLKEIKYKTKVKGKKNWKKIKNRLNDNKLFLFATWNSNMHKLFTSFNYIWFSLVFSI